MRTTAGGQLHAVGRQLRAVDGCVRLSKPQAKCAPDEHKRCKKVFLVILRLAIRAILPKKAAIDWLLILFGA